MICRRPKGRRLCHTAARISVPAMRGRLQTPCAPHVLSRRTPAPRRARKPPCNARALTNPARTACPLPAHARAPPRAQAPLQCAGAYKPRAHRMSSLAAHARAPPRAQASLQCAGAYKTPRAPHVLSRRTHQPRRAHKPPCNARALTNPARTACPLPAHARAPPRAQAPLQCAGAYKPRAYRMSSPAAHARAPPCAQAPLQCAGAYKPRAHRMSLPPRTHQPRCNARRLHSARSDPFLCRGAIPAST